MAVLLNAAGMDKYKSMLHAIAGCPNLAKLFIHIGGDEPGAIDINVRGKDVIVAELQKIIESLAGSTHSQV